MKTIRRLLGTAVAAITLATSPRCVMANTNQEWPPSAQSQMDAWAARHWRIDFMARHPDAAERVLEGAWCRSELNATRKPVREDEGTIPSLPRGDDGYDSAYCREADEALFLTWALPRYYNDGRLAKAHWHKSITLR